MVRSLVGGFAFLHSVWGHLQFLDLGGSNRQFFVQGRTLGEKTGLPLPEVDSLSVVRLTPGGTWALNTLPWPVWPEGWRRFPVAVIFRL